MSDPSLSETNSIVKPFEIMKLPYDIQYMTLKRFDLLSFIHLKKCSKSSLELCDNSGFVPDLYIDKVMYNCYVPGIVVDEASVNLNQIPMQCKMVVNRFTVRHLSKGGSADVFCGRKVTISQLELYGNIKCTPIEFNVFLEKHEVRYLFIHGRTDSTDFDCYNQPAVRALLAVTIVGEKEPLPTETFLGLRAREIEVHRLYQEALRPILNEWAEGSRHIANFSFRKFEVGNREAREQQFSTLFHTLFDDIETEREIYVSLEDRRATALLTRADGQRLLVQVNSEDLHLNVVFTRHVTLEEVMQFIAIPEI